jgi:ubiquinone/menaquinone biosynthesis C-methylase UbiE
MIDSLIGNTTIGQIIDFGCGDGVYSIVFAAQGCKVTAIDIDPSMVEVTRQRLSDFGGGGEHKTLQGGVETLKKFKDASVDSVLALNVLAYLDSDQCDDFYCEAARILKVGGNMIVTHSNELFDLFTFNKYTVAFYKKYFGVDGIEKLIVNPEKPDRLPLPIRENPLSFKYKLQKYGFSEEALEFSIPHIVPPLLEESFNPDDLSSRKVSTVLQTPIDEKWKLYFTCSIFGSRSIRI